MTSYANASSETSQDNNDDDNSKRNRKTQALSALLSATALGVFLEGCGGEDVPPPAPPTPAVLGSASNPFVGTAEANVFVGSVGADWVSYAGSTAAGVKVDLLTPADNLGWADGDTLTDILNIIGSPQGDTLIGNGGANTLRGGLGGDAINGNEGTDTVSYSSSSKGVRVDLSLTGTDAQLDFSGEAGFAENQNEAVGDTLSNIENIEGSAHADWLMGDGGNNIIRGGGGGDTISGGGGADTLYGGAGADTLHGNDGSDTVSYSNSGKGVRVALALTDAQQDFETNAYGFVGNANEAVGDTLTTIENIDGSAYADWLTGDGNVNTLEGGAGNDRLEGGAGADTYIFRVGDGTDTINDAEGGAMTLRFIGSQYQATDFTSGNARFARDGDNNLVITFVKDGITDQVTIYDAYDDDSTTGTGNLAYTIKVEYGAEDSVPTEVTEDYWSNLVVPGVKGTESNPFLGTAEAKVFVGSGDANWVSYAGSTADVGVEVDLRAVPLVDNTGWATGDTFSGIQNIIGTGEKDILYGNGDANIFHGNDGGDSLQGFGGNDRLYGGAGLDTIIGGAGNDIINGGAGSDGFLDGGDGKDTITGGTGADTLNGGLGADTYIFRVGDGNDALNDAVDTSGTKSIINLQFLGGDDEGGDYKAADFTESSALFKIHEGGFRLIIAIDKVVDSTTDKVTINNAFDGDGNLLYTINVAYENDQGILTQVTTDYWNSFAVT